MSVATRDQKQSPLPGLSALSSAGFGFSVQWRQNTKPVEEASFFFFLRPSVAPKPKRVEANQGLPMSEGMVGMKGAWLYGDYINAVPGVEDPVACATACENDEKCYHWNFQAEKRWVKWTYGAPFRCFCVFYGKLSITGSP